MFRNKIPETLKPGCLSKRMRMRPLANLERESSGDLSVRFAAKEETPMPLGRELLAA
jgi:hypothetical protein